MESLRVEKTHSHEASQSDLLIRIYNTIRQVSVEFEMKNQTPSRSGQKSVEQIKSSCSSSSDTSQCSLREAATAAACSSKDEQRHPRDWLKKLQIIPKKPISLQGIGSVTRQTKG